MPTNIINELLKSFSKKTTFKQIALLVKIFKNAIKSENKEEEK
jgi:hypothetical protein